MGEMTVCQTCGDEGYSSLLIHCVKCQIVAVHRYCVDGPPTLDDEETTWSCEDCVPRITKLPPSRKSERISTTMARVSSRTRARRKWGSTLSHVEKDEKGNEVRENSAEVTTNTWDADNKCENESPDSQIGQLGKNTTPPLTASANGERKNGSSLNVINEDEKNMQGSGSSEQLKQSTKVKERISDQVCLERQKEDDDEKMAREAVEVTRHKDEDLSGHSSGEDQSGKVKKIVSETDDVKNSDSIHGDAENRRSFRSLKQSTRAQKNSSELAALVSQKKEDLGSEDGAKKMRQEAAVLSRQKKEDLTSHTTGEDLPVKVEKNLSPETDEREDRDCISEEDIHETLSNTLKVFHCISSSQTAKQADSAEGKYSEVVEGTVDSMGDDTSQSCAISECRSRRKKRRRVIIEMEEYSDEEAVDALPEPASREPADVKLDDPVSSQTSYVKPADHVLAVTPLVSLAEHVLTAPPPPPLTNFNNHVPCHPLEDAIWRGRCGISNNVNPTSFGLEAHLSNKAFPIVHGAACALPKIIEFDIVPKRYGWPKTFEKSPPTGDAIGLYFFPVGQRDEGLYENLIDKMIVRDLMLTAQINNLELLVFCSRELPQEEWRFLSKYYLWGVFRPKQQTSKPSKPPANEISSGTSTISPLATVDSSMVKTSNCDAHHQALTRFPDTRSSNNFNNPESASSTWCDQAQSGWSVHDLGQSHKRHSHQISVEFHNHEPMFNSLPHDFREGSRNAEEHYHHTRPNDSILVTRAADNHGREVARRAKAKGRNYADRDHDSIVVRP